MLIYGAGMGGLLAANMLRRFKPEIREAQEKLPNNHSALLRFRTDNVGIACGIPFNKVKVSKAISYDGKIYNDPSLDFSNQYSEKVTGAILERSIHNLDNSERFIAPLNLIELMALNCNIIYSKELEVITNTKESPMISTIPMPVMMEICG